MRYKHFIYLLATIVLSSCGAKKKTVYKNPKPRVEVVVTTPEVRTPPKEEETPTRPKTGNIVLDYIHTYTETAKQEMSLYGIPASITLAQGILESGSGKGDLTMRSNNHFGIKCHKEWQGGRVYHDDDARGECFRKYDDPKTSFRDHSLFLYGRKRYFSLFKLPKDDYKGWARGLRKAGYATDPKYPAKLISLIERYKLYELDAEVIGKDPRLAQKVEPKEDRYTVKKGDTLYSIARRHKISVTELRSLNSLEDNTIHEGQTLFVKPLPKDF
ncbi:glucosaminidase domain-containing protein [Sungkyunkwania multivorans]|uniref:Peptidoglycan hydrolase n=1 Tax=Sungkyunkwania multivorans TaxID=1173618 RepID=A0ABW3D2U5_9FLAO